MATRHFILGEATGSFGKTGNRICRATRLKAAIFDWDGTLVDIDDREFYCLNRTLEGLGAKSVDQAFVVRSYYKRPFEVGTGPRMVLDAALAGNGVDQAYEAYRKIFAETVDRTRLQSGALELLQLLKQRGVKMGIATMRLNRSVVESELAFLRVKEFVDVLLTREDIGIRRRLQSLEETVDQRARIISKTLESLSIDPGDSFLVGDSWWDIRAGKQLGMKTVMVLTGFSSHNDFSNERPDLTVRSLYDLETKVRREEWLTPSSS